MLPKNTLRALALLGATLAAAPSQAAFFSFVENPEPEWLKNFYVKAGFTIIAPDVDSGPLEFYDLNPTAQLALDPGPYAGTGTDVSTEWNPSLTIGYILPWGDRHWSVETILAPPFEFEFYATGRARHEPLASHTRGGNVETNIPALGKNLGKTMMLPPTVTLVYSFFPNAIYRPYVGVGASYVFSYDEEITNREMTRIAEPDIEVTDKLAWVLQVGIDIDLYKNFFSSLDLKYVGGAKVEAEVTDIWLRTDEPLENAYIGKSIVEQELNPWVLQLNLGFRF